MTLMWLRMLTGVRALVGTTKFFDRFVVVPASFVRS